MHEDKRIIYSNDLEAKNAHIIEPNFDWYYSYLLTIWAHVICNCGFEENHCFINTTTSTNSCNIYKGQVKSTERMNDSQYSVS